MAIPKTNYKKPRRINAVSITFFVVVAALAYVGYAMWPAMALRLRVRSEIDDVLLPMYRANLKDRIKAKLEEAKIRRDLLARIKKAGVNDPRPEIIVQRDAKTVSITVSFYATVDFPGTDIRHTLKLAPSAKTDAARVDW